MSTWANPERRGADRSGVTLPAIEETKRKVRRAGHAIIAVGPAIGQKPTPVYSYTVGLTAIPHPELIITGLPFGHAHLLLNNVAEKVHAGQKYSPGEHIADVLQGGFELAAVEVSPEQSAEYLVMAGALYPDWRPVPALQLVYPDRDGRFPWHPGCRIHRDIQPLLGHHE